MSTTHERRRGREETPKDAAEAAAIHSRELYVTLADALPKGRASLGTYARRVTLMAHGDIWPNAGDWQRLADAGQRDAVVAFHEAEIERLRGVPLSDAEVPVPTLMREHTEAVCARLAADTDPSQLSHAINEGFDLFRAAGRNVRALMRAKHAHVTARSAALGRLGLGPKGAA